MATTRVEYEQSLAALERDAIERPFLFYTRLVATILAGILPIALALATFIICFHRARLDTLALLLFLPLFKLFISFLLTLLKPITNPSGIELHRRTAPKLFSTIQSLCHRLKVPFPDHILLDESFNAYVSITHRRFFIGRKNYLVLGLPLMTVLSSEQFNSIIVHELAHLKLGNILLDIWMQRINDLYHKYIARENSKGARYVMVRFLKWYFPLIERYFFVLYRLGEIISDRNASNISGNSNYAKALIVSIIYNNAVSEFFWEPLLNATEVEFVIPQNVYTLMIAALHNPIPEVLIDQSIDTSFEVMSKYIDPHPSMQERITHLGFPPIYEDKHWIIATELIPKFLPQKSAADEYIGSFLPEIVQEMDNTWWIAHIEDLRNLYNRRKEAKTVVAAIVRGNEELVFNDANEAWRYASAVFNASGADEALPCLNHVISLDPNHMRCRMLLGSLLLQKGNSEGITHLRYAMENSLDYAWKACRMIYDYYVIKGQSSTADQYARWGKGFGERVEQAKNECLLGESPASYFPHDWTENEVETLKKELARYPYINRASLVRKDVSIFPGQQCYFLIVWQEGMLPMNIERHSETEIFSGLKKYLIFPHTTFIVYLDSSSVQLKNILSGINNAMIYRRPFSMTVKHKKRN